MKLLKNFSKVAASTLLLIFLLPDLSAQDNKGKQLPQFLFPEFTKATILMKDGTSFSSILNYSMIDEMIISALNGVYTTASNPQNIDTVYLQNRKFVPAGKVFYEIIADGPVTFFLQNKCRYTPAGASVGYGVKSQSVGRTTYRRLEIGWGEVVSLDLPPDVIITPASVKWVRINNVMEKFSTERQLLKLFPDKETLLKEYIKREKLKVNVREDLISLGNYCETLMK